MPTPSNVSQDTALAQGIAAVVAIASVVIGAVVKVWTYVVGLGHSRDQQADRINTLEGVLADHVKETNHKFEVQGTEMRKTVSELAATTNETHAVVSKIEGQLSILIKQTKP